ncbi:MAG: glycoside hydrolase family 88 protein [Reinekea sp.]|jgi:unsaturated chondroitin disaccharide hydrolase
MTFKNSKTEISNDEVVAALDFAVEQIHRNLPDYTYRSQNHSTVNGFYPAVDNVQWTSGFWPGAIWLAYEYSQDRCFQYAGQIQVQSFLHRIKNHIDTDHHDMGFMFSPSCVSAWKLVADEDARQAAILGADQLVARFQPIGNFIQAWGEMSQPENYRYIIDALMNLPLLYWAAKETGNEHFLDVAHKHAETTLQNSIRDDGSTFHSFFMDRVTGEPVKGVAVQGYKNNSAWARGQAWAVYGMALLYQFEKEERYRDAFDRVLRYFLSYLPDDMIPYWDLSFTKGSEPRDSSSASIVACGLLEMARHVSETQAREYESIARQFMKSLHDNYAVKSPEEANGLVLHGTYSKKSPYNSCTEEGVDECMSWGDYFYMEALMRLYKNWHSYWSA